MIEGVNTNNPIRKCLGGSDRPQNEPARPNTDSEAARCSIGSDVLLEKAMAASENNDSKAVQRARQLLLSGQLDTPKNIEKAAQNILKYGI